MNLEEFSQLVAHNAEWMKGVSSETPASLSAIESALGVPLPPSIRWLLSTYGYSDICGISSLEDTASTTIAARSNLGLPERWIILNNWHDAGVVLLDCGSVREDGECPVIWTTTENLAALAEGLEMDADQDVFPDYAEYVLYGLDDAKSMNL